MKKVSLIFIALFAAACVDDPTVTPGVAAHVSSVSIEPGEVTLTAGLEGTMLTAKVMPEDAEDKSLVWESSDESVATVSDGEVTPLSAGIAFISATAVDGGASGTCIVTVKALSKAKTVYLDITEAEVDVDASFTLEARVYPDDAWDKSVVWESANPAIASVEDGVVTGVGAGSTQISVTSTACGMTAKCKVKVNPVTMKLTADMISTNAPMQYVSFGYTPDAGWADTNRPIRDDEKRAREARYATPENLWDGDLQTSFCTNFDLFKDDSSWQLRSDALTHFNSIFVTFEKPVKDCSVRIANSDAAWFDDHCGFYITISHDGNTFPEFDTGVLWGSLEPGEGGPGKWYTFLVSDSKGIKAFRIQPTHGYTSVGSIIANQDYGYFGLAEMAITKNN